MQQRRQGAIRAASNADQQLVPACDIAPSLIRSAGQNVSKLYVFYHGRPAVCGHIWFVSLNIGGHYCQSSWSRERRLPETHLHEALSVVQFNGDLYCFHEGKQDSRGQLWYNVLFSGEVKDLRGDAKVPETLMASGADPATVAAHSKLYCFYAGNGTPLTLRYNILDQSGQWLGDRQVPNTGTRADPGVVLFKDRVYCLHQGTGGQLWYNVLDPVTDTWDGDQAVPYTYMTFQPSAAVYKGKLYCFYQGPNTNRELRYNLFNGQEWEGDSRVPFVNGMSWSPSVVVVGERLYCFYQGCSYNGQLRYTYFDREQWAGDLQVPGATMSFSPGAATFTTLV